MQALSLTLLFVLALSISLPAAAQAQVYQWKDANGTVHFSDTPPTHGGVYKSVRIKASAVQDMTEAQPVTAGETAADAAEDADTNATARTPAAPTNRQDVCKSLSANIKVLQNPRPVIMSGVDGKQQIMTAEQRQKELDNEQSQFQKFCGA